eukprot:CAMPEP_0170562874 /NCGR_PEP_ID=MMETSP0211-20121228/62985_1 /TAXON_ID=311385 /ORGANISM="Pseudokeronopsis sp., Strain OXSARD2" /LENGTH=57 /DNA_ID=CAMNT_0010880363 /DNA_START=694 /DNA_END=867 /DNA_ORIENTATION=-
MMNSVRKQLTLKNGSTIRIEEVAKFFKEQEQLEESTSEELEQYREVETLRPDLEFQI